MRVILWGELFWPYLGGAEIFAATLMQALRPRGYEFAVVTSHDNLDLPDTDSFQDIAIHRFRFREALQPQHIEQQLIVRRRIAAFLREWAPQVILLNGVTPSAFYCLNALKSESLPLLVRLNQDLLPHQRPSTRGTLLEHALLRANWVASVSAAILAQARQLVADITMRSSVIYNGVDTPAAPPAATQARRILCLGRLVPNKGFDIAVDAFARLRAEWPDARLIIAGDGAERSALEQQVNARGISDAVEFLGWVPPEDVGALLANVAMLLMPSREEGLPNVALQAAAHAVPIVSTGVGGIPEVVRDGETGLVVDGNASALATAMATLLTQPAVARRMGLAGWNLTRETFAQTRCIDAYDEVFRRITATPS